MVSRRQTIGSPPRVENCKSFPSGVCHRRKPPSADPIAIEPARRTAGALNRRRRGRRLESMDTNRARPDATDGPAPAGRSRRRLTAAGWLWLAVVAALLGIGIAKNINLLALLGYALLALLLLNAAAAGRRLRRLAARRDLPPQVFAGSPARVVVRVSNTSARRCAGARVGDRGPAGEVSWFLDDLAGHEKRRCEGELRLPRRGWCELGPVVASSAHPFGLVRREVEIEPAGKVLVLPRPGRLQRERLRLRLRGADPQAMRTTRRGWRHDAAQADFHGLRPFRPGDSPRWIHWRTTARRGEVMVRELEDVPGDDLVLVFDATGAAGEPFEQAVSLAATVVWEWSQRPGDRLVLAVAGVGGEVIDGVTGAEHARRLLGALAVVSPAAPAALAGALRERAPASAGVVVVTAGGTAVAAEAEAVLGRPALLLDVARQGEWDFYTP